MTHKERAERRDRIVADARAGMDACALVKKYGVGLSTVKIAVRESGFSFPRTYRPNVNRAAAVAARNAKIIAALEKGDSPGSVAHTFGVCRYTVHKLMRAHGIKSARQHQKAKTAAFHAEVAEAVRGGMIPATAALKFGITPYYVREIAKAAGVTIPRAPRTKFVPGGIGMAACFGVLADYESGMTLLAIAEKHAISLSRVTQIVRAAREAGLPIGVRWAGSRRNEMAGVCDGRR